MKDKFDAIKQKLKSLNPDPTAVYLAGAFSGSVITSTLIYFKLKHDADNLLLLPLGKEAFTALVNDETNFVRFWTGKHDHAFRVSLEQWI